MDECRQNEGDIPGRIKCVVWDLDDTIWHGTLAEVESVAMRSGVRGIIQGLDDRGILQSIASRNDFDQAWGQLAAFGLNEYFIHPQINWGSKSDSIRRIAGALSFSLDAIAFVDDQAFERDEVRHALPAVTALDAAHVDTFALLQSLMPTSVTKEARARRAMYQADVRRKQSESSFSGTPTEFLATLGMRTVIRCAEDDDLLRAEELTVRTHQLNTTGRTYSHTELRAMLRSSEHQVLVADLEDRYGTSGTIGLAVIEQSAGAWLIALLITSCRVMSRGVGGIMLTGLLQEAKRHGVSLQSRFVPNERNRMMYLTYKFNGFVEVGENDGAILLEHPLDEVPSFPWYVVVEMRTTREVAS